MRALLVALLLASVVSLPAGRLPAAAATTSPCARPVAPYFYPSWGSPQDPAQVMRATGVRCYTVAFVLAGANCTPLWGVSPLGTSAEARAIARIRSAGGDVIAASGGATSAQSLEVRCGSAAALARAYRILIDTFALKYVDIDLEGTALASYLVQDKVLAALRAVRAVRPHVAFILTVPSGQYGLHSAGVRLVARAAAWHAPVNVWSIMPFDFGNYRTNMGSAAVTASQGLHATLRRYYPGLTDAQVYARQGISAMNGVSDTGEIASLANFTTMRSYAATHRLARLTFWALNRDRQCTTALKPGTSCSGVIQTPLAFTKVFAAYV